LSRDNASSNGSDSLSRHSGKLNEEFSEIALEEKNGNGKETALTTISSGIKGGASGANRQPLPQRSHTTPLNLTKINTSPLPNQETLRAANVSITEKLEKALTSVAPFLKDIFVEFAHLLSK